MSATTWNPANRFDGLSVEWDQPVPPRLQVILDDTREILATNDSPDVAFSWSVNAYRGCTHACAYCYARPFHEYLGLGAGTDFDRIIHVKARAPELLERALRRPSWRGEVVAMSGVTDPYQPLERTWRLTRGCLEVLARFRNPVAIITRSPLITRDLDLLGQLAEHRAVHVSLSIPLVDDRLARALEPGAPPPAARLRAMEALAAAGVPVGVSVSPLIPGLGDALVPEVLQRAAEAGATWAWTILLRLPGAVAPVFERRLRAALPDRADAVLARLKRARGGQVYDRHFHQRMTGQDPSWEATGQLFDLWRRKLGLGEPPPWPEPSPFRVPGRGVQQALDL